MRSKYGFQPVSSSFSPTTVSMTRPNPVLPPIDIVTGSRPVYWNMALIASTGHSSSGGRGSLSRKLIRGVK